MFSTSRSVVVGVFCLCLWSSPATAQSPLPCDATAAPHQAYRTQETLLVVPNGTSAPTIYIGIEHKGVYKSTDGGVTWTRRSNGIKGSPRLGSESEKCVGELGRLVVDPNNREHLYLLTVGSPGTLTQINSEFGGVYETMDGGGTWTQLTGYGNAGGGHALAVRGGTPSPTLFMGVGNGQASWIGAPPDFYNTTGVVYRSTTGGATWTELDQRLTPGTGLIDQYLAATRVFVDATGLKVWVPATVGASTGGMAEHAKQVGFLESVDGGTTWIRGTNRLSDAAGRAGLSGDVAPANFDHRLLSATNSPPTAGANPGPAMSWYTRDGVTWAKTSDGVGDRYIHVGRYSPHDPTGDTIYGYDPFSGAPGTSGQGILKSINGGATWAKIGELPTGVDNERTGVRISHFAFHPTDANIIYAAGSMGYVWKSTDAGVTWTTLLTLNTPVVGGLNTSTPTAPGVTGTPTGNYAAGVGLLLSWTAPTQGGLPTSYIVQTATDAAFTTGVQQTTVTQGGPATVAAVGDGTWAPVRYARVYAVNAIGQSAASPTATFHALTPRWLNLQAIKSGAGGSLFVTSSAVAVQFPWTGTGSPAWTVTDNAAWLQITGASGAGPGQFVLSIADPTNSIGASTLLTAEVTLSMPSLGITISTPVTLRVQQTLAGSVMPFGQVDTPAQNATGVQGAIGVTGWALDNVGVASVKIYRNCLSFENQASCQVVLGNNVVEVGDAAFLSGARPDVEAAFQTLPANHRAGWGYLMLTSMLPHVGNQQGYGGQGPLTLYAVATDVEGNQKLLGRSSDPASPEFAVPTAIIMANDTIAKPFGAIDTPAQGATVSGVLNNFGWALTPDSNTTGGEGADILIPTNGSTMTVFIDGLPTALVTYNQCRGNVGNPVPAGVYCNDDVANIFGNATPQPVLTTRSANATRYRNLDATRAAIGSFTIDTTTLSNGLHTIAWSVTDSANRTEGIGSRFFNVLNAGAVDAVLRARPAQARGEAATLAAYPTGDAGVWYRTGFDLTQSWSDLPLDANGARRVTVDAGGRVELWLGAPVDAGYLVANGELRDLPPGSSLRGPQFAWTPPVGYVGDYTLGFIRGAERIEVIVTIR
jgi:hypothetical protein